MLAIYTRLSKEDSDSTSIDNQLREGKEFAKKNGFDKYKIYNEGEGVSGTLDLDDRPQLYELYQDIKKKKYKGVWFRNQNRLGRNEKTYIIFLEVCIKSNTKIFYDNKEFDYTDPNESLQGGILSLLNSYTAKLQSKQTIKVLLDNAREGKGHSINAFGYTTDKDNYLIIDKEQAKTVKRAFKEHANGKGCGSIAYEFTQEQIPSKYTNLNGKKPRWSDKTIQDILKNPIYKGQRRWGKQLFTAPPIVTPQLWQKSMDAFITNANNGGKKVIHKYLLKGLLKCGYCGRNYYAVKSKKNNFYMCSSKRRKGESCGNRSINIDLLERFIWSRFFINNQFKKLVKEWVNSNKNNTKESDLNNKLEGYNKELIQLSNEKKNAIKLAIKGLINEEDIQGEIKQIENKIKDVDIKINQLKNELEYYISANEKQNQINNDIKNLKENTPFNTKRELIYKYIKQIKITEYKPLVYFDISFHLPINNENYFIGVGSDNRYLGGFTRQPQVEIDSRGYSETEIHGITLMESNKIEGLSQKEINKIIEKEKEEIQIIIDDANNI